MITEDQLRELGFVENKDYEHHGFNEWVHTENRRFGIGDYNGEVYLIDGIDWHQPITDIVDLAALIRILKPYRGRP